MAILGLSKNEGCNFYRNLKSPNKKVKFDSSFVDTTTGPPIEVQQQARDNSVPKYQSYEGQNLRQYNPSGSPPSRMSSSIS